MPDGDFTVMEHRAREQVDVRRLRTSSARGSSTAECGSSSAGATRVDGTGWRVRPYLKYSLPIAGKTALNLSSEPFFNLNTTPFQRRTGLDRMRNLITISTPLTKTLSGEVGYMNQHGLVKNGPDTSDNVAYFGLALSL